MGLINRPIGITADAQGAAWSAAACHNDRNPTRSRGGASKDHKRQLNHSRAGLEMIFGHMERATFGGWPVARYLKPTRLFLD
jgi:hypothetical protein